LSIFNKWIARLAALVIVSLLLYSEHETILRNLALYLVYSEEPMKADVILVLAGDFQGQRVMKGCELAQQGYAPKVWVSGPDGVYGLREADLAVDYAIQHGCPASLLEPFYSKANSTLDEARLFRDRSAAAKINSYLLVTSNFHTRRAAKLFRREIPGVPFRSIGAEDKSFDPASWWQSRPSRKVFAFEWLKTVTEWVGM
jgi:uncharacterized SAM-binding protein YcdF (DUF218 family)